MSAERILPQPAPPIPSHLVRVEYLGFRNAADYREYRLAVYGPAGPAEFLFRIAFAAFTAERVRIQDGPDICYQRLLKAVAVGESAGADAVTIGDVDLASYREAHTHVPKHRPWTSTLPAKPAFVPRPQPRRAPQLPVAAVVAKSPKAGLDEGQRVSHAAFGVGVVASSSGGHTVVRFDEGGPKTFITSMVKLEVLSAPHTWETGPRGKNRPREATLAAR